MESLKDLKHPQHYLTSATQKLIAQAWKIHMFRRMMGLYSIKNAGLIFKRHQAGINDILPEDIISYGTSWSFYCSDDPESSVQVNFVEGSDIHCDCIDYPYDYVCKECKICIHMYTCSCQEVDEFPSLICKHIHAVCQFGEGVVQKPDIKKHSLTPHRTPGHRWPNPMVFRLDIRNNKKKGFPRGLVAVSSENINVDKDLASGNFVLPPNWETDIYKDSIAQEHIRNEIKETLSKRKLKGDDISILFSKKTRHDDSQSQENPANNLYQNMHISKPNAQEQIRTGIKETSKREQEGDDISILFSKNTRHDDAECQTDPVDNLYQNLYLSTPISNSNSPQDKALFCRIVTPIIFEKKTCEKSPIQATEQIFNQSNLLQNDSQQNDSGEVVENYIGYDYSKNFFIYKNKTYEKRYNKILPDSRVAMVEQITHANASFLRQSYNNNDTNSRKGQKRQKKSINSEKKKKEMAKYTNPSISNDTDPSIPNDTDPSILNDTDTSIPSSMPSDTEPSIPSSMLNDTDPSIPSNMPNDTNLSIPFIIHNDTNPVIPSSITNDTNPSISSSIPNDTYPSISSNMPNDTEPSFFSGKPTDSNTSIPLTVPNSSLPFTTSTSDIPPNTHTSTSDTSPRNHHSKNKTN